MKIVKILKKNQKKANKIKMMMKVATITVLISDV